MINRVENNPVSADSGRPDPEVQAGRALRRLRLSRNWSQEEVAGRMKAYGYDFHQTMIAKIEAAQRPLRVRELAHFAALYGVEVQDLIYPPTGSLHEVEQEIEELEARQAHALGRLESAVRVLAELHSALHQAQNQYEDATRETAILEGRLVTLREEHKALINWGFDEESSFAKGRKAAF